MRIRGEIMQVAAPIMECEAWKKMQCARHHLLSGISVAAFLMLIVSLFTDHWLTQQAVWPVKTRAEGDDGFEILRKQRQSHSGLWRICCNQGSCAGVCRSLQPSSQSGDAQATTSSLLVIAVLRNINVFPIGSVFLAFLGCVFLVSSQVWSARSHVLKLAAGVNLVVSGLTDVLGIIIFISSNDRPSKGKTSGVEYGWSFYCAGMAFIIMEAVGVAVIQELVKNVEQGNRDGVDAEEEESGVTRSNSYVNHQRSIKRRRSSYWHRPRLSLCDVNAMREVLLEFEEARALKSSTNGGRGCVQSSDQAAETTDPQFPAPGLPTSDSGYNGASSMNLREAARVREPAFSYCSEEQGEEEDRPFSREGEGRRVDGNKPGGSSSAPRIEMRQQIATKCADSIANVSESSLSFPPPAEFLDRELAGLPPSPVGFFSPLDPDPRPPATDFYSFGDLSSPGPNSSGGYLPYNQQQKARVKKKAEAAVWKTKHAEQTKKKHISTNFKFLQKFAKPSVSSSFDSNMSSAGLGPESDYDYLATAPKSHTNRHLNKQRRAAGSASPLSTFSLPSIRKQPLSCNRREQQAKNTAASQTLVAQRRHRRESWIAARGGGEMNDLELGQFAVQADRNFTSSAFDLTAARRHKHAHRLPLANQSVDESRCQTTDRKQTLPGLGPADKRPFQSSNCSLANALRRSSSAFQIRDCTSAALAVEVDPRQRTILPPYAPLLLGEDETLWTGNGVVTAL